MAEIYPHIKHTHWLLIIISVILFNLRFWWRHRQPNQAFPLALRVIPHVNDTLLLLTGIMMAAIAKWSLMSWLGVKLLFVIAYIALGIMCLRSLAHSRKSYILYAMCLASIGFIVWIAHCKFSTECHFFANWI